jgi:hypothetical protein
VFPHGEKSCQAQKKSAPTDRVARSLQLSNRQKRGALPSLDKFGDEDRKGRSPMLAFSYALITLGYLLIAIHYML